MTAQIAGAVAALALLTLAPGPDVAVVTRAALAAGRAGAVRAAFGVAGGLLVWGVFTVAGLSALLAASSTAYAVVKAVGAAYLVWLGIQTLWRARGAGDTASRAAAPMSSPGRAGFTTNVLNPKIGVFYTGVLPQLVPGGAPRTPWLCALVVTHVLLSVGWLAAYGALVQRAAAVLQRPRVRRAMDRLTGTVLLAFGARVATAARHS